MMINSKDNKLRMELLLCFTMFYYVYILQSINFPDKYYTGYTTELKHRIKKHNEGGVASTAKYKPWKIKNAKIGRAHV